MRRPPKTKVKQKDGGLTMREFFSFLASVLVVMAALILFTWQRLQVVWLENRISEGLKNIRVLEDSNRNLKLRRAAFRSLARVTRRAENEFGMAVIEKGSFIVLDE
jgi:cell division protein FtsL